MVKCKECGQECSAMNALGYHLRTHGISYPEYFVKHELAGNWPHCKCGKRLEYKKGFPKHCSATCATSGESNPMYGRRGEKSPIKGIKRTEEQLKNYASGAKKRWELHGDSLRQMMQDDSYRDKMRKSKNEQYESDPSYAQRIREGVLHFWSTSPLVPTLRAEASARAVRLLAERKIGPGAPYKQEWKRNPWTGQDEWMHSSWESAFLDACIARSYEVHKDHGVTIPYRHPDGTTHTYVPDFYAPEDRTLYEVKGRWDETDLAKWEAAGEWCERRGYRFCLMFEEEPVWAE